MSKESINKVALPFSLDLKMDFGKYGGMYVPDPFAPALDNLADAVKNLENNAEFIALYKKALAAAEEQTPEIEFVGKMLNSEVYKVRSTVDQFVVSGYMALVKFLKLTPSFAVESEKDLKTLINTAQALNLKPYVALNKNIGSRAEVVRELQDYGYQVEVEKCATLFNEPVLYAFQYYISNIASSLYISRGSNVGPYPFLSITSAFIDGYAKVLKDSINAKFDSLPTAILAEGFPGTSAIAVFKAFENSDVRTITFEKQFEIEREDCFCGIYTKVVEVDGEEKVLSPELILGWENGEIDRVFAEDFSSAIAAIEQSGVVLIVEENK